MFYLRKHVIQEIFSGTIDLLRWEKNNSLIVLTEQIVS